MAQTLEERQGTANLLHERRAAALYHRHARLLWLVFGVILALQLRSWWAQSPDATQYLSIARSLAQGHGLMRFGLPNLIYQPGYAILISPAFMLADRPFLLLSAFQIVTAAVALYLVWRWARAYIGSDALVVVALVCVNIAFLQGTRRYLSEIPGLALLVLAGLTLRWAASRARTAPGWLGAAALAILAVCAACMVRYASICLIPGLLLVALLQYWKPRTADGKAIARRAAGLAVLCGICAIPLMLSWIIHDRQQSPGSFSNFDYLLRVKSGLAFRILDTLRMRCSVFGQLAIPGLERTHTGPGEWFNAIYLLFGPVFLLVLWGWWRLVLRSRDVLIAAAPFYFGIYVAWPDDGNTRFFMPMLPVIWFCLWRVMATWRQWRYVLVTSLIVVHLGFALAGEVNEYRRQGREWKRAHAHLVTLAPQLQPWRQNLAVRGISTQWWLAFEVDRSVIELKPTAPISPRIEVILQPTNLPLPDGFATIASSGPIIAVHRDPTSPAPASQPADDAADVSAE